MSQATLIGLCSDNLVTILQPSSTIQCSVCPSLVTSVGPAALGAGVVIPPSSGTIQFTDISSSVGAYLQIAVGTAVLSQTPIPSNYRGPVTIPFQTLSGGLLTVTLNGLTGVRPTYSYSTRDNAEC
jgi:hypothetical protein